MLILLVISATFAAHVLKRKEEAAKFEEMKKQVDAQMISKEKMAMVLNVLGVEMNPEMSLNRLSHTEQLTNLFHNAAEKAASQRQKSSKALDAGGGGGKSEEEDLGAAYSQAKGDEIAVKEILAEGTAGQQKSQEARDAEKALGGSGELPGAVADGQEGLTEELTAQATEDRELEEESKAFEEDDKKQQESLNAASAKVMQSLHIDAKDIHVTDFRIAKGAFGEIHKGTYLGRLCALKTLLHVDKESIQLFKHEIILSSQLRHPNIIQLLGACWDPSLIALVMEFAEEGSLDSCLKANFSEDGTGWTW